MGRRRRKHQWANELDDVVRGACGGFLFGTPLLYTMEVWWIGSYVEPWMMLAALGFSFIVIFLLNRTAGFRKSQGVRTSAALMETVEAIAIGLICATFILTVLREITPDVPIDEAIGKIIFEGIPFTLGVALANQFLGSYDQTGNEPAHTEEQRRSQETDALNATISDVGGTLTGATIIASSIAPTDEVSMLAAATSPPWLIMLIVVSLLVSYSIVFQADFANQTKRRQQRGIFQRPLSETVMTYLVSLLVAALMLDFFQQLTLQDPWQLWLSRTIILGLPAAIGGAAGRLAI